MRYRNMKTGAIIDVKSKVTGDNWEKVEEVKRSSSTLPRKARGKKNE